MSDYPESSMSLLLRYQDEREELLAAIRKHKEQFPDEALMGEIELWAILEKIK